jgi:hypothetical protein
MCKYALFSLLPTRVEILQAEEFTPDEIEIIENYALPFGSSWSKVVGARVAKVFPVGRNRICVAYTIVSHTGRKHANTSLHCLASIHETHSFDKVISSSADWLSVVVKPIVNRISDLYLRELFQESLSIRPALFVRLKFRHRLGIQFHVKLMPAFYYESPHKWVVQEEYARRLYLARRWQYRLLGIAPPSFTTLTLSKGEFTDIAILGVPVS